MRTLQSYYSVRRRIHDGDLLLFRPAGIVGHIIARAGRSAYSHVGTAVWSHGVLLCCETIGFGGSRATCLSALVRRHPGLIDVYRPQYETPGIGSIVAGVALRLSGQPYGWWGLLRLALRHALLLRFLHRTNGSCDIAALRGLHHPVCSEMRAICERLGAGVDPVPNLPDHLTEPGDLARSPFYMYQFTLGRP